MDSMIGKILKKKRDVEGGEEIFKKLYKFN